MTWAWYSSWLSSSAARSGPSCSAAIQDSAASSTSFLPIVCTPASSACTVPDPSGRLAALSLSSLQSSSNVFIRFSLDVGWAVPGYGVPRTSSPLAAVGTTSEDARGGPGVGLVPAADLSKSSRGDQRRRRGFVPLVL